MPATSNAILSACGDTVLVSRRPFKFHGHAQEGLARHTQYWVLRASTYRYSVGGRLSITVHHTRCWNFPAASARISQRTLSHLWRPLRARYHERTRLHVQCPTFLYQFNKEWNVSTNIQYKSKIRNFTKICPAGVALFRLDGQTGRQTFKTNSLYSQIR